MKGDDQSAEGCERGKLDDMARGFFPRLMRSIPQDLIVVASVFVVARGISAAVCLYYGLPLVLSLIGGFLSIGTVFL